MFEGDTDLNKRESTLMRDRVRVEPTAPSREKEAILTATVKIE